METHILEINLISAQGLKTPSSKLGRMKTFALAWVDSANKLRTRVDRVGAENPTWNDKFLFRVTPQFLASETSGVSVEIYAVGYIRDYLIGSARFLISNFIPSGLSSSISAAAASLKTPSFTALQIRRPSGRFHGVLNVGVTLVKDSDFPALDGVWAIGYRDLMGGRSRGGDHRRNSSATSDLSTGSENTGADYSDVESTTSSTCSPAKATALKDWNGVLRNVEEGKKSVRASSGNAKYLCGLLPPQQKKTDRVGPSDQKVEITSGAQEEVKRNGRW